MALARDTYNERLPCDRRTRAHVASSYARDAAAEFEETADSILTKPGPSTGLQLKWRFREFMVFISWPASDVLLALYVTEIFEQSNDGYVVTSPKRSTRVPKTVQRIQRLCKWYVVTGSSDFVPRYKGPSPPRHNFCFSPSRQLCRRRVANSARTFAWRRRLEWNSSGAIPSPRYYTCRYYRQVRCVDDSWRRKCTDNRALFTSHSHFSTRPDGDNRRLQSSRSNERHLRSLIAEHSRRLAAAPPSSLNRISCPE